MGREELFEEVDHFVRERPTPYGILKALAGMGKTAVMAKLYGRYAPKESEKIESGDRWAFLNNSNVFLAGFPRFSPVSNKIDAI